MSTDAETPKTMSKELEAKDLDVLEGAKDLEALEKANDPEAPVEKKEDEEKPQKPWEKRGELFGLIIGFIMIWWFQSCPLSVMFGHASYATIHQLSFPCSQGGPWALSSIDAALCGYLQASTVCFAPLAYCVMILYLGRELLQKRLYYGLLRQHGVLGFASNDPMGDPLAKGVIVLYLHVLFYFIFILYATGVFESSGDAKAFLIQAVAFKAPSYAYPVDKAIDIHSKAKALQMVTELFAFYIMPSTLFLVFFYCGYDIESSLVPLSQYVHDASVAGETDELSKLMGMGDAEANQLVAECAGEILAVARTHEEEFLSFKEKYEDKGLHVSHTTEHNPPTLGLLDALWPAFILLPERASDETSAIWFRRLYYIYFGGSLIWVFMVVTFMYGYILWELHEVWQMGFTPRTLPRVLQLGVTCVVANVCIGICARLIQVTLNARALPISRKEQ